MTFRSIQEKWPQAPAQRVWIALVIGWPLAVLSARVISLRYRDIWVIEAGSNPQVGLYFVALLLWVILTGFFGILFPALLYFAQRVFNLTADSQDAP